MAVYTITSFYYKEKIQEQCVCRSGYHGDGVSCTVHIGDQREDSTFDIDSELMLFHCFFFEEKVERLFMLTLFPSTVCEADTVTITNELGAYRCVCVPPYSGDGVTCIESQAVSNSSDEMSTEQQQQQQQVPCNVVNNCDTNGDCIFEKNDRGDSVYRCRCRPGFSGDGYRCAMTSLDNLPAYAVLGCDQLGNCDRNAECVRDAYSDGYFCRCLDGFEGDGYSCKPVEKQLNLPILPPGIAFFLCSTVAVLTLFGFGSKKTVPQRSTFAFGRSAINRK
ncbi:unnamed protein product [Gongylonema pulchrum]|uniref:EGF-like domain-containing protein n=1 Tax=Gongylonema pulchrum TaxID=637853 RepID=A0A183CZ57_9BILA|nr:unnamed protein product [Gongylonema pulchrum]